jgi:CRISPR-associated protein Cas5d
MIRSDEIHVRLRAPMAMYTRPEYRTERVSNVVGSHAAYEGLLKQIMGHHGCHYEIHRVGLLFIPRWLPVTSNEVADFGTGRKPVDTTVDRTLRTTLLVAGKRRRVRPDYHYEWAAYDKKDERAWIDDAGVDYIISFQLVTPDVKYIDILDRRLRGGRSFTQPYLGMREYVARVDLVEDLHDVVYPGIDLVEHPDGLKTVDYTQPLGVSFFGTDWEHPPHANYFYPIDIKRGVVTYPGWAEVRKLGIKREVAA